MSLHLVQLQTACLALKSDIDAALVAASLAPLDEMVPGDGLAEGKPAANRRPRVVVSLAGPHGRRQLGGPGGGVTLDEVVVTFAVQVDGSEAAALAYEGVVAGVVRGARAGLRAAMTAGHLDMWQLTDGSLERDTTRRNATGWTATVAVLATVQW